MDHGGKLELARPLFRHAQADEPPAIPRHEIDGVGGYMVGRDGQISFIFAVLVIDEDHHLPGPDVLERVLDPGKRHLDDLFTRTRVF